MPRERSPGQPNGEKSLLKRMAEYRLALALTASTALHVGAGAEIYDQTHERVELKNEREKVQDTLFLPISKEELVKYTLSKAQIKNPEELKTNPEKIKNIDFGLLFLQIEFLEGKINAEEAKKAYETYRTKVVVLERALEGVSDLGAVLSIANEIVEPQITQDSHSMENNHLDYQSVQTLLSGYFLSGKSNCYGSERAFLALTHAVRPDIPVGKNKYVKHTMPMVFIDNAWYRIDVGTEIIKIDDKDRQLEGSVMYPDAKLGFLEGVLGVDLTTPILYYSSQNPESLVDIPGYQNTRMGNVEQLGDPKPTLGYPGGSSPAQGNRHPISFAITPDGNVVVPPTQENGNSAVSNPVNDKIQDMVGRGTPKWLKEQPDRFERKKEADRAELEKELKEKRQRRANIKKKIDFIRNPEKTDDQKTNDSLRQLPKKNDGATSKEKDAGSPYSVAEISALAIADRSLIRLDPTIPADKIQMIKTIEELDRAGYLQVYKKRYIQKANLIGVSYKLQDKRETIIPNIIVEFENDKKIMEDTIGEQMRHRLIKQMKERQHFSFLEHPIPESIAQQYPQFKDKLYSIPADKLDDFISNQFVPTAQKMKKNGVPLEYLSLHGIPDAHIASIIRKIQSVLPEKSLAIRFDDSTPADLSIFEEIEKNIPKKMRLALTNPYDGQPVGDIMNLVEENRVEVINSNLTQDGYRTEDFFYIDTEKKQIINLDTFEKKSTYGDKFLIEWYARIIMTGYGYGTGRDIHGMAIGPLKKNVEKPNDTKISVLKPTNEHMVMEKVAERIAPWGPYDIRNISIDGFSDITWLHTLNKKNIFFDSLALIGHENLDRTITFDTMNVSLKEVYQHSPIIGEFENIRVNRGMLKDWGENIISQNISCTDTDLNSFPPIPKSIFEQKNISYTFQYTLINGLKLKKILDAIPVKTNSTMWTGGVFTASELDDENIPFPVRVLQEFSANNSSEKNVMSINIGNVSIFFIHYKNNKTLIPTLEKTLQDNGFPLTP